MGILFTTHGKPVRLCCLTEEARVSSSPPGSLSQWLAHQKTCPQCRERCLPRNVIKLFIDDSTESLQADNGTLGPQELKVPKTLIQRNLSNPDTNRTEESVKFSSFLMSVLNYSFEKKMCP